MHKKTLHPLFEGLISKLPNHGSQWPIEDRAKWLRAAASITELVYQRKLDEPTTTAIAVIVTTAKE